MLYVYLLIFITSTCVANRVKRDENIQFNVPDLTTTFTIKNRRVFLDAYRVRNQTRWVSIGSPFFVGTYELTPESVWFNIRVLDDEQREALVRAAQRRYPSVGVNDFGIIPLQQFVCESRFTYNGSLYNIRGEANDFHSNDISVELSYTEGSEKRQVLEARIQRVEKIVWKCTLSAAGQLLRSNILKITSSQMQQVIQDGQLFGAGGETYVTRHQMNQLAQKIRTDLQIEEIYELDGEDFDRDFINKLLGITNLQQVDIDEALNKISKFGVSSDARDLSPSEIKRELSNKLMIKSESGKNYISSVSDSRQEGSQFQNSSTDVRFKAKVDTWIVDAELDIGVNYAQTQGNTWKNSDRNEHQQLQELNRASQNHIQWEIQGNRIIPKSLNVAKLSRASITRDLAITSLKTRVKDAQYKKTFIIQSMIKIEERNETQRQPNEDIHQISDLRKSFKELSKSVNNLQFQICDRIQKQYQCSVTKRIIYVGTNKGLFIFNDKSKKLSLVNIKNEIVYDIKFVYVYENNIFIGTKYGLFISEDGINWIEKTTENGLIGNEITYIFGYNKTNIYVGTTNGLSISLDKGQTWITVNKLKNNSINCIYRSSYYLFIGTNNELFSFIGLDDTVNERFGYWEKNNTIKFIEQIFESNNSIYLLGQSNLFISSSIYGNDFKERKPSQLNYIHRIFVFDNFIFALGDSTIQTRAGTAVLSGVRRIDMIISDNYRKTWIKSENGYMTWIDASINDATLFGLGNIIYVGSNSIRDHNKLSAFELIGDTWIAKQMISFSDKKIQSIFVKYS